MTNDSGSKAVRFALARLQTRTQNLEEMINQAILETDQEGREAAAVEIDFETFVKSWTAMLVDVHDLADKAGIDLAVLASGLADLFLTIEVRLAHNEELREMMQRSLTTGVANIRTLADNIQWLNEVDANLIADYISMVRSQAIMDDAIAEIINRGEPATDKLRWIAESLKKRGY